jgi:hypothetical protein
MSAQGLFKGMAVVIDDELAKADSEIVKIIATIKGQGGHVVGMEMLPGDGTDYQNFSGAAFFIMDWQLHAKLLTAEDGFPVPITPKLAEQHLKEKIEFLTNLKKTRLAPVFIFTNDDPDVVKDALHDYKDLYQKDQPSHIFVYRKIDVLAKGVFSVLNDWIEATPSVLVLKTWEHEYEKAKNAMFADFYSRSIYWPALLWKTFDADGIPASDELGRIITRNLFSRMTPFHLNLEGFSKTMDEHQAQNPKAYQKTLLEVLEGERFIRTEGLHEDSIAPGDIFKDGKYYFINIRPDCDCVIRGDMGDVDLYLLKGVKLTNRDFNALNVERGNFSERDDEAIIFAMHDGASVSFKLKDIHVKKWSEIKAKRIGRLLSPFLTRVQQRYSSYLQRPGLPKIPKAAMPPAVVAAAEAAIKKAVEDATNAAKAEPAEPEKAEQIKLSPEVGTEALAAKKIEISAKTNSSNKTALQSEVEPIVPKRD